LLLIPSRWYHEILNLQNSTFSVGDYIVNQNNISKCIDFIIKNTDYSNSYKSILYSIQNKSKEKLEIEEANTLIKCFQKTSKSNIKFVSKEEIAETINNLKNNNN